METKVALPTGVVMYLELHQAAAPQIFDDPQGEGLGLHAGRLGNESRFVNPDPPRLSRAK
jgi:hypothetical protein